MACVCSAAALFLAPRSACSSAAVQVWQQTWAGTSSDVAPGPMAARELVDGSTMIVGGAGWATVAVARYDHDGNLLSAVSFSPPYFARYTLQPPNASQASLVAIDSSGSVFIASASNFSRSGTDTGDLWLMKYDGLTGKPRWPAPVIFHDPAYQGEIPVRLLIDSFGNPVLVGRSRAGAVFSIATLKYDGVSNTLLWGPARIPGVPVDTTFDPSGNVFVASSASIAKLDGQTGAIAWGPTATISGLAAIGASPDGNIVVTGYGSNQIKVAKYSGANGGLLWGPSIFEEVSSPPIQAVDVKTDALGDVVLSGISASRYILLKYSGTNGVLQWGPVRTSVSAGLVFRIAGDGDLVASGTDPSNAVTTSRYSGASGALLWGPLTDGGFSGDQYGRPSTLICPSGRIFVATIHSSGITQQLTVFERDPDTGTVVWSSPYQAPTEIASRVEDTTQGPDGSVLVTGYVTDSVYRFVTFKYARDSGAIVWGPVYYNVPAGTVGYPYVVRADSSGDVFVLGTADSLVVLKYSGATGALLWGPTRVPGVEPSRLAIDTSGDALVLGQSYGNSGYDFVTLKLSGSTGAMLWGPVTFDSGSGQDDFPTAIALTPGGDVIVAGDTFLRPEVGTYEWVTLKYSGTTGSLLWGPVPLESGSYVRDLGVEANGDVVATGSMYTYNGYGANMATIKYNGLTGAVLWGPVLLAGSGNYYDYAEAVALDANGDAIVTGHVYDHNGTTYNYDIATIKYRGSDGAVLWGPQIFNGAGNGHDYAFALGLDASGSPVVGGDSYTASRKENIVLLKYDGATGAPIWGPILSGGIGDDDLPLHNLVVKGKSVAFAGTSSLRFLAAAYDEVFGIQTVQEYVPPAYCGQAYSKTLVAGNATGSVTWGVVSGALPAGLSLNGTTGEISGAPAAIGSFAFRVKAQDAVAAAFRDFVLDVFEGTAFVPILSTSNPVCLGQSATLSVSGSWTSYHWLPGGETSSTISVSPSQSTDYGVLLQDAAGCGVRGYVRVFVGPLLMATVNASNNGPICAGQTLQLSASTVAGATYFWTGPDGFTSNEQNPQIVSAPASASGLYRVTATVDGCSSAPAPTTVVVNALPSAMIASPSTTCPNTAGLSASVPSAGGGATYTWTITNGTITAGAGTSAITFTAGASGSVQLGVTVTDVHGCAADGSRSVSITPGPACEGAFNTLVPCRQYDSRDSTPLLDDTNRVVTVIGASCGVPADATAVSVNITVFNITGAGGNAVFQVGTDMDPTFAWINYPPSEAQRGNAGFLPLNGSGQIVVRVNQGGGRVDFTVDVNGYFQ